MTSQIVLKSYHWPQAVLESAPPDGVFFLALNMTNVLQSIHDEIEVIYAGTTHVPAELEELLTKNRIVRSSSMGRVTE